MQVCKVRPSLITRGAVALILSTLLLVQCRNTLQPSGIYGTYTHAKECMRAIRLAAYQNLAFSDGSLPNCLRMAFHDAATYRRSRDTGGANGSVLNEVAAGNYSAHAGLNICHDKVLDIVPRIRADACPELTYADAIAVLGAAAAEMAGFQSIPMLLGRPDNLTAFDDVDGFVGECFDSDAQIKFWAEAGMSDPTKAAVTLSSAHGVGTVRVSPVNNCKLGTGPMTPSSRTFDNHYYDVAANPSAYPRQRLLFSDRLLANGSATSGLFETYRTDQSAWAAAFTQQFQEMTMLGVQPSGGYGVNDGWCDGCGEYRGLAVRSSSLPGVFRGLPDLFP
ncbi:hypothetical protein WJX81_007599 [Elliptochloris bilobata]|uniref:Plant heme peroxidase family profile domain-containing protein n=1 Tax=Elliptochloris bilobata TaxID=381761 RepID=A0AAW1SKL0_9CHLO